MMKSPSDVKFKADTHKTASTDSIEFLVPILVTDKNAKESFRKAEEVYNSLKSAIAETSIKGINLELLSPEALSDKNRFFRLAYDPGIKKKISVSIDLLVKITFETEMSFWSKGIAISEVVDCFEQISDNWNKEKEVSMTLGRLILNDQDDSNEEDNKSVE